MTFQSLIETIDTKLNTISELALVKKFHTTDLDAYPAATVEMSEDENIVMTTVENLIDYNFDVIIHQEMTVATREEAHRILAGAADAVINAFNEDFTLGGAVDFVRPLTGPKSEYVAGNGPVLFFRLSIKCVQLVNILP